MIYTGRIQHYRIFHPILCEAAIKAVYQPTAAARQLVVNSRLSVAPSPKRLFRLERMGPKTCAGSKMNNSKYYFIATLCCIYYIYNIIIMRNERVWWRFNENNGIRMYRRYHIM